MTRIRPSRRRLLATVVSDRETLGRPSGLDASYGMRMAHGYPMKRIRSIIGGAGLAGSEAALQPSGREGSRSALWKCAPKSVNACAQNRRRAPSWSARTALKSTKPESAAGMLKAELAALGSQVHAAALDNAVRGRRARLAVDREAFARQT